MSSADALAVVWVSGTREAVLPFVVTDIGVERFGGHDPLSAEHRRGEYALARLLPQRLVSDARALACLVEGHHFRISDLHIAIVAGQR